MTTDKTPKEHKSCPMTFAWINNGVDDKGFVWQTCHNQACAWWHEYKKQCAILSLARSEI